MLQKCVFNRWWVTAAYRPCLIFLSSLCSHPPLSLTIQVDLTLRWSRCSATWNLRWFALRIRSPPPQSFIIQWIPGALWTQWSTSFLSALSESLSVVAPQTAAKQHAPQLRSTAALQHCWAVALGQSISSHGFVISLHQSKDLLGGENDQDSTQTKLSPIKGSWHFYISECNMKMFWNTCNK